MEFKINKHIFDKLEELLEPSGCSRSGSIGRLGILGGNKDIIDSVIFPRITGGCSDCPSISRKNLSEAFLSLVKNDRTIYGLLRYVNEVCENEKYYNRDKFFTITTMLYLNMRKLIEVSKHNLLLIISNRYEHKCFLGCKNPHIYLRVRNGFYCKFPEGKILSKKDDIITVEFTTKAQEKKEEALIISNTPKTKIVSRSYSMTNEEIIILHNRPREAVPA